jgi:hypothetical protein
MFKRNFFHLVRIRIRKVYAFKTKSIAQGPSGVRGSYFLPLLYLMSQTPFGPSLKLVGIYAKFFRVCQSSDDNRLVDFL